MVALEATRTATESELDSSTFAARLAAAADDVAAAYAQVRVAGPCATLLALPPITGHLPPAASASACRLRR